ncbi:MAG: serine/threonine-protein kinase, partial [Gemmatimonadaceae bacterium]
MTDQLFDHLQSTLGDSYRLERELGGGGMGRVFVAEETTLERKVVVKVLPPELGRSLSADRFRREIQLAAKLQHPHIVPLLAAGATPEGMLYYTMPFIEGDSLRRRLTRAGELPIPEALRILRQVVDALAYAHARGVVHRDIKPDNVLLSGNHAMVTDFGVSKALSTATGPTSLTSLGVALGTPAYMAPEQAAADPNTDHRADIYAIGILAYELLTGHPPFQGSSPQQVLAAHATVQPPRIIPLRASVPQPVEDLVMLCLEKHAADRPQSAEEVLQRLETLSTPSYGTTPSAIQPTKPVKTRRRFPSGKAVAVGAAAGVIALAALGASLLKKGDATATLVDKRVLFAGFENRSRDSSLDAMGVMATDWMARTAANDGGLEIASPEDETTPTSDAAIIAKARSENARAAIHGSYYRVGDSVQFQLAILDAAENRVWRTLGPFSVAAASPGPGLDAMAKRVAGALAYMFQGFLGRDLSTTLPNLDAAREYLRADAEYRSFFTGNVGARGTRDRAVSGLLATYALDTAFTWALVRAAQLGSTTNDCRLTDSLGTVLAPARARMGAPEEAYLDRVIACCRCDWGAAYAAAQRLRRAAPRSDEAKSVVGYSAPTVGRARESANAFAGMVRPFQTVVQYQAYSDTLHLLGDTRAERRLGSEIQQRFPEEFQGFLAEARSYIVAGKH